MAIKTTKTTKTTTDTYEKAVQAEKQRGEMIATFAKQYEKSTALIKVHEATGTIAVNDKVMVYLKANQTKPVFFYRFKSDNNQYAVISKAAVEPFKKLLKDAKIPDITAKSIKAIDKGSRGIIGYKVMCPGLSATNHLKLTKLILNAYAAVPKKESGKGKGKTAEPAPDEGSLAVTEPETK